MAGQIPRPTNVETTNTGTTYHIQEDGSKVIAGTRRPDGTYRKPVRVRAGYTPLEENLYKGPEVQQRAQARGIPGLGPETQRPSARSGHIPGMAPDSEPKAKPKAKPKEPKEPKPQAPKAEVKAKAAPKAEAKAEPAKPENRLRNLRKKLAEIDALEERAASDLSEEQKQKISRKDELQKEIQQLLSGGLSLLQKLHLGHNRLARIDSLESCTQLEELMVPHQQPPVEAPLQFCPTSIAAISSTLNVLNTAGNRLEDLQELTPLRLSTLDLSENKIRQVGELKEVISGDVLRRVTLQGNPFAFHDRRYRSAVVLCSTAIEEIDGREVLPQERDFVRRLDEQKRKLNAQRKKHLNRAATDGRPRNLGAMPEKGSGRQLKPAEGESWGLQDWKF